jgi:predicted RNA-binding Zn-ribbon protein involved in translation (DUF1610 family)
MGIIDSTWFRFTCPKCGTNETVVVHDKGSGWSGSAWGTIRPLTRFDVTATGGGKEEPEVKTATCKTCGVPATVDTGYGTSPS